MTETLSGVVSSTTLGVCPRELLGMLCLAGTGYDCLCKEVQSATVEVLQDGKGAVLLLSLQLFPGNSDWSGVRKNIALSGYRADWRVVAPASRTDGMTVGVTFDLWRPQNAALQAHTVESGI